MHLDGDLLAMADKFVLRLWNVTSGGDVKVIGSYGFEGDGSRMENAKFGSLNSVFVMKGAIYIMKELERLVPVVIFQLCCLKIQGHSCKVFQHIIS